MVVVDNASDALKSIGRAIADLGRSSRAEDVALKPCPFCGAPGRLLEITNSAWPDRFWVECENEDCMSASMCTTRARSVFSWNRRVVERPPVGSTMFPLSDIAEGHVV